MATDKIVVYELNLVGRTGAILTDDIEDAVNMILSFIRQPLQPAINTLLVRKSLMERREYERLEDWCNTATQTS